MERFLRQQGMRKEQIEREMEKAYEQYFSTLAKKEGGGGGRTLYTGPKNKEQEKEEMWERMTNPHLFGESKGAYRKTKVATLYYSYTREPFLYICSLVRPLLTTRRSRRRLCRTRSGSGRGERRWTTVGRDTGMTGTGTETGTDTGRGRITETPGTTRNAIMAGALQFDSGTAEIGGRGTAERDGEGFLVQSVQEHEHHIKKLLSNFLLSI